MVLCGSNNSNKRKAGDDAPVDAHTLKRRKSLSIGETQPGFVYKVEHKSWWGSKNPESDVDLLPANFATLRMAQLYAAKRQWTYMQQRFSDAAVKKAAAAHRKRVKKNGGDDSEHDQENAMDRSRSMLARAQPFTGDNVELFLAQSDTELTEYAAAFVKALHDDACVEGESFTVRRVETSAMTFEKLHALLMK